MKNSLFSLQTVIIIGLSIMLGIVLIEFHKKYSALETSLHSVEQQLNHLSDSLKGEGSVDSLISRVNMLEKKLSDDDRNWKTTTRTSDVKSPIVADKPIAKEEKLLSSAEVSKLHEQRLKKVQEKSHNSGPGLTSLTVGELYGAYEKNDVIAQKRYGQNFILLRGKVYSLNNASNIVVTLASKDGWRYVKCSFDKRNSEELLQLKKEDRIVIKGKYIGGATLKECSLVK